MLGRAVPGAGHLGVPAAPTCKRCPKTSVEVDGSKAFVTWKSVSAGPHPFRRSPGRSAATSATRVPELTGLDVDEVHITVAALATDITPPPRVR